MYGGAVASSKIIWDDGGKCLTPSILDISPLWLAMFCAKGYMVCEKEEDYRDGGNLGKDV